MWVAAAPFQCRGGASRRTISTRRLSGIALLASLGDWLRGAMASVDRSRLGGGRLRRADRTGALLDLASEDLADHR